MDFWQQTKTCCHSWLETIDVLVKVNGSCRAGRSSSAGPRSVHHDTSAHWNNKHTLWLPLIDSSGPGPPANWFAFALYVSADSVESEYNDKQNEEAQKEGLKNPMLPVSPRLKQFTDAKKRDGREPITNKSAWTKEVRTVHIYACASVYWHTNTDNATCMQVHSRTSVPAGSSVFHCVKSHSTRHWQQCL